MSKLGGPRLPIYRVMEHITATPNPVMGSPCWITTYALDLNGYGVTHGPDGDGLKTHRVAYEALVGRIPDGLQLDHRCRNRACCNPEHLEAVTSLENSLRGEHPNFVTARTGICKRGHVLEEVGIRSQSDGRKRCKACDALRARLRRAKQVAA